MGGLVDFGESAGASAEGLPQGFELSGLGQQYLARLIHILHLVAVGVGVLGDEVDVLADVFDYRLLLLRRRRDRAEKSITSSISAST